MVEIMALLVVLALFGAMAVPRGGEQPVNHSDAGPKQSNGAVKTAHATAIAELKRFPTVAELSGYVKGIKSSASASGIQVVDNGVPHSVPTYSDSGCRKNTRAITDTVACVGTL